MTAEERGDYGRQMDEFLMRRIDKLESDLADLWSELAMMSANLDKIAAAQENSQPSISAMKSVIDAGWMLKWAVSTVVVICAGFATVMTAWETLQKWLVK